MFDPKSNLPRRVFFSDSHGQPQIIIQRQNDRAAHIYGTIVSLVILGLVSWSLAPALFRVRSFTGLLYVLPVFGFFMAFGVVYFWSSLRRAFGVEKVALSDNTFVWTREVFGLTRKIEVAYRDITGIVRKTLGMGACGRRYKNAHLSNWRQNPRRGGGGNRSKVATSSNYRLNSPPESPMKSIGHGKTRINTDKAFGNLLRGEVSNHAEGIRCRCRWVRLRLTLRHSLMSC